MKAFQNSSLLTTAITLPATCSANGKITLSATGGTPPYLYGITSAPAGFVRPPQSSPIFDLLPPGNYSILVKDADGQKTTVTATVAGNYLLPSISNVLVQGSKVNLTVSGGLNPFVFSFSKDGAAFSSPQNQPVFDCLENGNYVFKVADGCQNTVFASRQINVPAISFVSNCTDNPKTVTISNLQGGESPFSYSLTTSTGTVLTSANGIFTNPTGDIFTAKVADRCGRAVSKLVSCSGSGVLQALAETVAASCPSAGKITVNAAGGLPPYQFGLTKAPLGVNLISQASPVFPNLPAGVYEIQVKDASNEIVILTAMISNAYSNLNSVAFDLQGSTMTIFNLNTTLTGTYLEPTMDSCKIKGSTATVFASGGRLPHRFTFSLNGAPFVAFQDSSVFDCLTNGDYEFRIYDSCANFYSAKRQVLVPGVYFNGICSYDTSGATDIQLANIQGGEPPYSIFSVSNLGDTILPVNGSFIGLKGCNFTVFMLDKCKRTYSRYFDCPPNNIRLYFVCSNSDDGTAQVEVVGGTPPYIFREKNNPPVSQNLDGIFDNLPAGKVYVFEVEDACGRKSTAYATPIWVNNASWRGCPFDGKGGIDIILFPPGTAAPIVTQDSSVVFKNLSPGSYTIRASDACGISSDFTGSIGPLQFSPKMTRFCNGKLDIEVPEIVGATYEWTTADSTIISTNRTISVSDTTAKSYFIKIKTADGCIYKTQADLVPFSPVAVLANAGFDLVSDRDTFSLAANPGGLGVSSTWKSIAPSTGLSQIFQKNLPNSLVKVNQIPGLYSYEWALKNAAAGCLSIDTVTVVLCKQIDTLGVQLATTLSSCSAATGTAVLSVSGGQDVIQYLWSTGDTTANLEYLMLGIYAVTVSDGKTCTRPVVKKAVIEMPEIALQSTAAAAHCFGNADGTATISATGGTNSYQFLWLDGKNLNSRNDLFAGVFVVTVTDSDGCFQNDTIEILEPPLVQSSQKVVLCFGEKYAIGNAVHATTSVFLDVLKAKNGCYSLVTTDLFIKPKIKTEQSKRICKGEVFQVGSSFYEKTGQFSDVLQAADGCDSTVTTGLLVIDIQISILKNDMTCTPNGSIEIGPSSNSGSNIFSFSWDNGSTASHLPNLSKGIYQVTVGHEICEKTEIIEIQEIPTDLKIKISGTDLTCFGIPDGTAAVKISNGKPPFYIGWTGGAGGPGGPFLEKLFAGKYLVSVTDENGCTATDSVFFGTARRGRFRF